jgi:hypothetical protein
MGLHFSVIAQTNTPKFEIGAGLAGFVYQGDLTPNSLGSFRTIRPGLVLSAAKLLDASFAIRVNAAFGGLKGDETRYDNPEYRKLRAFKFRTPVIELSGHLVWNPFGKQYAPKGFAPYLFGGIGLSYFNIRRDASELDLSYFGETSEIPALLAEDEARTLPKLRMVIPAGLGVRYHLSSKLALNIESAYRIPFTDYLDGFSRSANPSQSDHYHSVMIGGIYRIGNKNTLACPVIKY